MTKKSIDYIGKKHGRLQILSLEKRGKYESSVFHCLCDCGVKKEIDASNIKRTHSCGCFRREFISEKKTIHGKSHKTKVYQIWYNMKTRCNNPKATHYECYGGRGITVCDRWNSFENFYNDMGDPPEGMTIERIDVNGNYEPSNCKWISFEKQGSNKRNNRIFIVNGQRKTLTELANEFNLKIGTLWARLQKGWSLEKSLSTQILKRQEMKNL